MRKPSKNLPTLPSKNLGTQMKKTTVSKVEKTPKRPFFTKKDK